MNATAPAFHHALEKLEFEKIRQRLSRFVVSGLGESMIRACGPIADRGFLESEHAMVAEMRGVLETEDVVPVHDIRDVRAALKRCTVLNTRLDPAEFVDVLHTLRAARALRAYFDTHRDRAPGIHSLADPLYVDKLLERHIELTVDAGGRVLDTAGKRLRTIRDEIIVMQEHLRKQCARILRLVADKEYTQDDILTQRDGRMVIPLKAEHKRKIPGVVHSVSQTGQTVFVEPSETLELNNDIVALQFEEQKEIATILRDLTDRVRDHEPELRQTVEILRAIEFLYVRARYSMEVNGAAPQFSAGRAFVLSNARHPMLIAHHGWRNVQPLSVELGGEVNTLVISGPNAGGKTIALKTVGLIALMAQSGLHVPADPGTIVPIFDDVFVDMGDDQSVENDLSTFSSHLRTIKTILERSTEHSLVLLDEIGMGTDPTEGGALAMSVLSALTRRAAITVATTHHGALKAFAHETPAVANAGMEFDVETLTPTYRLHVGRPGSSYAFEIARTLDFPEHVLAEATSRAGPQQASLEQLLHSLEASLHAAETARVRLETDRAATEAMRTEYEHKLSNATREARDAIRSAKGEARQMLDEARGLIERTIRELKEQESNKSAVREVRERFERSRETIVAPSRAEVDVEEPALPNVEWRSGLQVAIVDSSAVGTLLQPPDAAGIAVVQMGDIKMKVQSTRLRAATKADRKVAPLPERRGPEPSEAPRSLDLRGMYSQEAQAQTDLFLAEALASNYERVEIIHGKGTGVLRNVVHAFLKSHPGVVSFRLAEWNAGGSGATVVELKHT